MLTVHFIPDLYTIELKCTSLTAFFLSFIPQRAPLRVGVTEFSCEMRVHSSYSIYSPTIYAFPSRPNRACSPHDSTLTFLPPVRSATALGGRARMRCKPRDGRGLSVAAHFGNAGEPFFPECGRHCISLLGARSFRPVAPLAFTSPELCDAAGREPRLPPATRARRPLSSFFSAATRF